MSGTDQEAGPSALFTELRLDHLNAFYASHNKDPPKLPYQRAPLNMEKLWDLVRKEGGYAEACQNKRWASIARDMGAGPTSTNASFVIKNLYTRSLLPYENSLRGEEVVFAEKGSKKRKTADNGNAPKTASKTPSKAAAGEQKERKKKRNNTTAKYISESDSSSSDSEEIEDSDSSDSDFELEGGAAEKERATAAQPKSTPRSPGSGSRGARGGGRGGGRRRVSNDGRAVPQRNAKTATETAAMAAEQLVTLATTRARRTSTGGNGTGTGTAARGARGDEGTPARGGTGTGGGGRGGRGGGRGRGRGRGRAGRVTPRAAKAAAAAAVTSERSESPYTSGSDVENEEDVVDVGEGGAAPPAVPTTAAVGGGQAPRVTGGASGSRGYSGRANLLAELEAVSKPQQDWTSAAETTLDGCKAAFRMALLAAQATPEDGSPDALLHVAAGLVAVTADELTRLCHENAYLKRAVQAAEKRAFAAELETATARGAAAEAKYAFSTMAQQHHQQQHQQMQQQQQQQQHGVMSPHGAL